MKANEYRVLQDCVEEGVAYGYNRAYKYSDKPSDDTIKTEIENAVLNQICEYFNFEEFENYDDE